MVNENLVKNVVKEPYKYGFVTDIETEKIEKGLNEDIIKLISLIPTVLKRNINFENFLVVRGS